MRYTVYLQASVFLSVVRAHAHQVWGRSDQYSMITVQKNINTWNENAYCDNNVRGIWEVCPNTIDF